MPKSVLIVDDDMDLLESLMAVFEEEEFAVYVAPSGMSALEVLTRAVIDVVVLDVRMPAMDGLEVLNTIRQVPTLKELPIVLNSASTEIKSLSIQDPHVSVLVKPFGLEEIVGEVERLRQRGRNNAHAVLNPL